jgi:hypothetical protein
MPGAAVVLALTIASHGSPRQLPALGAGTTHRPRWLRAAARRSWFRPRCASPAQRAFT